MKPWTDIFLAFHGNEIMTNIFNFGEKYMHGYIKHRNVSRKEVFQSHLPMSQALDIYNLRENSFQCQFGKILIFVLVIKQFMSNCGMNIVQKQ